MSKEERFMRFVEMISKLEPVEYCGLCQVLCVDLFDGGNPKPFDKTLEECMDEFLKMKKGPRKQLMRMLEEATKKSKKQKKTNEPLMTIDRLDGVSTHTAPDPSMATMSDAYVRTGTTSRASDASQKERELI